jgi:hypothetical protein
MQKESDGFALRKSGSSIASAKTNAVVIIENWKIAFGSVPRQFIMSIIR